MDISDKQIAQYWADDATVVRGAISQAWRDRLAAAIERDIALNPDYEKTHDSDRCPLVYAAS